ncbi:hypothetical protein CapIbe_020263 [Capra ibex]
MKNRSNKPAAPSPSRELLSARGRVFVSRRCVHPVPRTERLQTAHVPSLRTGGSAAAGAEEVNMTHLPPSVRFH